MYHGSSKTLGTLKGGSGWDAFCCLSVTLDSLLQDSAAAWERWVYMFAQWRQLPAMAPHIPIQSPTLRQTAYEMMLHAFLLNRADHSILLALVKDWPTHLYSVPTLIEAVLHRSALCPVAPVQASTHGRHHCNWD